MREHLKNPWCQSLTESGLASHHFLCNPFTLFDTLLQSLDSLWLIFRCVSISRTCCVSHRVTESHCHIVTFSLPSVSLQPLHDVWHSFATHTLPLPYFDNMKCPKCQKCQKCLSLLLLWLGLFNIIRYKYLYSLTQLCTAHVLRHPNEHSAQTQLVVVVC